MINQIKNDKWVQALLVLVTMAGCFASCMVLLVVVALFDDTQPTPAAIKVASTLVTDTPNPTSTLVPTETPTKGPTRTPEPTSTLAIKVETIPGSGDEDWNKYVMELWIYGQGIISTSEAMPGAIDRYQKTSDPDELLRLARTARQAYSSIRDMEPPDVAIPLHVRVLEIVQVCDSAMEHFSDAIVISDLDLMLMAIDEQEKCNLGWRDLGTEIRRVK